MNTQQEIKIITNNLKGIKNTIIRQRAMLLIRCLKHQNKTLVAEQFGCSRQKFYYWIKRLRENDYNIKALLDLSKKPLKNPRRISKNIINKAIQTRKQNNDSGALKTSIYLKQKYNIVIHASTLGYIFKRQDISKKYRIPKKNKHQKRYSLEKPLERVQTDTTNLDIVDNFDNKIKAYPVVDDSSRMTSVHVAIEHSSYEATKGMQKFFDTIGIPKSVQTDNGVEFTNYYTSLNNPKRNKQPTISFFDNLLEQKNIYHKLIRPATPQLNGKVERFNQTFKRECVAKLKNGMTLKQIQKEVDHYITWYNKKRVHASLNYLTPQQKFLSVRRE